MGLWETNQSVIPEFFQYKLDEVAGLTRETENAAEALRTLDEEEEGSGRVDLSPVAKMKRKVALQKLGQKNGQRTGKEVSHSHIILMILTSPGPHLTLTSSSPHPHNPHLSLITRTQSS